MAMLELLAPAKLNLFLHVTGRRADGYHELQTLFQLLDYGDQVRLSLRPDGQVERTAGADALPASADLSVKAARLLQSAGGTAKGCDIGVLKRIPVGAGLGGGSSDAAAVMIGLNRLWQLGFSGDQLAELGLKLGADVPVFVRGCSAWAEGIGERLRPVSAEGLWYLVATPGCPVSTAAVFGSTALTRNTPALKIDRFTSADSSGPPAILWDALWAHTRNDCEPVATAMYPQVGEALRWLSAFAEARMTGTGGSVFAPFPDRAEAERVLAQRPDGLSAFIARGMSRIERTMDRLN